jgi:hypothetical protein
MRLAHALLAGVLLVPLPAAVADEPASMSVEEGVRALDAMAASLDRRDVAAAGAQAEELETRTLACDGGTVPLDPALMDEVRHADAAHAPILARRVSALAAALRTLDTTGAASSDRGLIDRLRAEADVARGGTVAEPNIRPLEVPESLLQRLQRVVDAIGVQLDRLLRWLYKLWPDDAEPRSAEGGAVSVTLAAVAAAVAVFALLAVLTVRRHRAAPSAPATAPPAKDADEDPLSRESSEWERYARELAAAGRRREAVRAWYHAVLSALFRTARLEPRKGRTNWEHVARLGPELGWRPSFIEITRRFEREWYGRDASTAEALADCARLATALLHAVRSERPAA